MGIFDLANSKAAEAASKTSDARIVAHRMKALARIFDVLDRQGEYSRETAVAVAAMVQRVADECFTHACEAMGVQPKPTPGWMKAATDDCATSAVVNWMSRHGAIPSSNDEAAIVDRLSAMTEVTMTDALTEQRRTLTPLRIDIAISMSMVNAMAPIAEQITTSRAAWSVDHFTPVPDLLRIIANTAREQSDDLAMQLYGGIEALQMESMAGVRQSFINRSLGLIETAIRGSIFAARNELARGFVNAENIGVDRRRVIAGFVAEYPDGFDFYHALDRAESRWIDLTDAATQSNIALKRAVLGGIQP